jgi:hypothetical protein
MHRVPFSRLLLVQTFRVSRKRVSFMLTKRLLPPAASGPPMLNPVLALLGQFSTLMTPYFVPILKIFSMSPLATHW